MATIPSYNNAATPVMFVGNAVETGDFLAMHGNGEWAGGEKQKKKCQDIFWAILFYLHLAAIGAVTAKYAPLMTSDIAATYLFDGSQNNVRGLSDVSRLLDDQDEDAGSDLGFNTVLFVLGLSGLSSCLISTVAMTFMMSAAQRLIKIALFFTVFVTALLAILALVSGARYLALILALASLLSLYYAYVIWSRIPFAASNLVTATCANMGLAFVAYSSLMLSFLWTVWWGIALIGTNYVVGDCKPDGTCAGEMNGWFVFLFLCSYFWTAQVVKNVVHVSVAGTVGSWWFTPFQASGCCSQGIRDSAFRSVTTSFGSICLGSLFVPIISTTKEVLYAMRVQDCSFLLCLAECLLGCIESLIDCFNGWAFVFVGLCGCSFMEAGSSTMALFRSRGWTSIVTDILVDSVLQMVSLGVGVLTGLVVGLTAVMGNWSHGVLAGAPVAGMVIGFILCSTMFSLVSSGVNTVIVCFAAAPAEFQKSHPQLSEQMQAAWRHAYPNEFQY